MAQKRVDYVNKNATADGADVMIVQAMEDLIKIAEQNVINCISMNVYYHKPVTPTPAGEPPFIPHIPLSGYRYDGFQWISEVCEMLHQKYADSSDPIPEETYLEFAEGISAIKAGVQRVTRESSMLMDPVMINAYLNALDINYYLDAKFYPVPDEDGEMIGFKINRRTQGVQRYEGGIR